MLLYLSIFGLIISLIILSYNIRKFQAKLFLGIFFLLLSLYGLNQWVFVYSGSVFALAIFSVNFSSFFFLIGPSFFIYVRSVLKDDASLNRKDLLHILPAIIYLFAAVPHFLTPFSHKMDLAEKILTIPDFIFTYKATLLADLIGPTAMYYLRPAHVLFYTIWSVIIFISYLRLNKNKELFQGQVFMIKWLSALMFFLTGLSVGQLAIMILTFLFDKGELFYTVNLVQVISATGLTGLLLSPLFFPEILYGLPRIPIIKDEESGSKDLRLPSVNSFESDYMDLIAARIEKLISDEQPYLQVDFNIVVLAKLIHTPSHHLAYYFREVRKQSFNDYKNLVRVNHSKNLLVSGKAVGMTLEAIGLLSGFANRISFFRAFKKVEGVSPGQYLTAIKNNESKN